MTAPVAYECVITIFVVQYLLNEDSDDCFQFSQIGALSGQSLDIASKSGRLPDPQRHGSTFPVCEEVVD
jgi:hypothetical protein